jgi:hypothetical protein
MRQLPREIQPLDIEELEALNLIYLQQVFQPLFSGKPLLLFVNLSRTSDSGQPTAIHWKTQENGWERDYQFPIFGITQFNLADGFNPRSCPSLMFKSKLSKQII